MTSLLKDFWQGIGNVRRNAPSGKEIDEYLVDYDLVIPPFLSPIIPSLDIVDCIINTNNSCPGPDGVHFAFIRPFAHKIAPIIEATLTSLANGFVPPPGLNNVFQFYIPKGDSLLPKDTRPVSVANAIGRIIAKLLVNAIIPAAQALLRTAQKGFVPGRQSQDHIVDVTTEYYSKLEKKQQHFLLLLDTEKAFDSLDHGIIFKVVKIQHPT